MGKNLKGKQLGKGLGQRKDGLYYARCRNYRGEREERCFKTLPEAKNWRQEQLYLRLHPEGRTVASPNMTVDAWFNQWVKDVVGNRAPNTVRNYREDTSTTSSHSSVLCCCAMSSRSTVSGF